MVSSLGSSLLPLPNALRASREAMMWDVMGVVRMFVPEVDVSSLSELKASAKTVKASELLEL